MTRILKNQAFNYAPMASVIFAKDPLIKQDPESGSNPAIIQYLVLLNQTQIRYNSLSLNQASCGFLRDKIWQFLL